MSFTFDATEGGATANSYVTVAFADNYFGGELYADEWNALVNATPADLLKKQQALVKATRRLDKERWDGVVSSYSGQALKHPRSFLQDENGLYYNSGSIITPVKDATCVLALHYLRNNPVAVLDRSLSQFSKLTITGAIELEMRAVAPDTDALPDEVQNMVYRWMMSGAGTTRLSRA